jgi:LPXTG-motif cell wall-anchored protein
MGAGAPDRLADTGAGDYVGWLFGFGAALLALGGLAMVWFRRTRVPEPQVGDVHSHQ